MSSLNSNLSRTLEEQLAALRAQRIQGPPELLSSMLSDIAAIAQTTIIEHRLNVGDPAPDFSLPDSNGRTVTLSTLVKQGPVVITFYRGAWCGYCDLHLRAYHHILPQIQALGATLVAISPQSTAQSKKIALSNDLTLLSDRGNQVARQYQLVYNVAAAMRQIYVALGIDLAAYNDDDSGELPLPGTFIVDQAQRLLLTFVNPDYTRRLEPTIILETLQYAISAAPPSASKP